MLGASLDEVANDSGVDFEEVVASHTRLSYSSVNIGASNKTSDIRTRNSGGDDDDIGTGQGLLQTIVFGQIAGDFLRLFSPNAFSRAIGAPTAIEEMWERSAVTPGVPTTS